MNGPANAVGAFAAQDTSDIAFPEGYRTWYHHHSTVNQTGHDPVGIPPPRQPGRACGQFVRARQVQNGAHEH